MRTLPFKEHLKIDYIWFKEQSLFYKIYICSILLILILAEICALGLCILIYVPDNILNDLFSNGLKWLSLPSLILIPFVVYYENFPERKDQKLILAKLVKKAEEEYNKAHPL